MSTTQTLVAFVDLCHRVRTHHPDLQMYDLYLLGRIEKSMSEGGLPLAFVRQTQGSFGSMSKFAASAERLVQAGLINRETGGESGRSQEVVFTRTATAVDAAQDFVL